MSELPLLISELPKTLVGDIRFSVPLKFRRGSRREDEKASIESAVTNLRGIAERTGRADWSNQKVLDFGCGVKFTQALLQYDVRVQTYVGMDVYKGLIEYLNDHVERSDFLFFEVPFHNEMYNPQGVELTGGAELPGDIHDYDLIVLQSVFTHFGPDAFQALLHVLRRYCAGDGRMLFTCFINNDMKHDFFDSVPDRPLLKAFYKESFIRDMLEKSRWKPLSLNAPSFAMAHHFVCEPY
jgi:SAM-dependent methyltransferase